MGVRLDDERRERLIEAVRGFHLQEFEQELSAFRAEQLLDFFLEAAGAQIYNQAVQDARRWMLDRLDDLDAEIHLPEVPL